MTNINELLKQKRKTDLWQLCCGFIDLNLEQFMAIQRRLLQEQLELLKDCKLTNQLATASIPTTIESFRKQVPLTTYIDYCPELLEKREDTLPQKPELWLYGPGTPGEYSIKQIPLSQRFYEEAETAACAALIFATSKQKGMISLNNINKVLSAINPLSYLYDISQDESIDKKLPIDFKLALSEDIYSIYGSSWLLPIIGKHLEQQINSTKALTLFSHPRALIRLLKGITKSKLARRQLLPGDLWTLKGIISTGIDSAVYSQQIKNTWGIRPLEIYGNPESLMIAMQTWDYNDMTFIPNLNFLEFIPEEERQKEEHGHSYQPKTVLLDEVKAGENYELVITSFHGGALIRYKVGDIIKITKLRNENLNIEIPQMAFVKKADNTIDLGVMHLTEKIIWQAMENTNIPFQNWTARKEIIEDASTLHLYLELKDNYIASERGIATAIYKQIKKLNDARVNKNMSLIEKITGLKLIQITLLPEGSFLNYSVQQQNSVGEVNFTIPHINPSDSMLSLLGAKTKTISTLKVDTETAATANL